MNIKYTLVNVIVTYIVMIGVAIASPPALEPIAVETVEGNPLDVTVTNLPTPVAAEVRKPFTDRIFCYLSAGQNGCHQDQAETIADD